MESYVIRIYRREEGGRTIGHLISPNSGDEQRFHNAEQLLEQLGMGAVSTHVYQEQNLNNTDFVQKTHIEKETS